MKLRNLLLAGAATAALGGCAAYPYDDYGYASRSYPDNYGPGYYNGPGYYDGPGYYTGPGYYSGPSVGFGLTYSDRRDSWRRDERRDEPRHRDRDRDHDHDH